MIEQWQVPSATFKTRVRDESIGGDNPFRWQDVTTDDIFKNKQVVLFALPLSLIHTCSCCLLYTSPSPRDRTRACMPYPV